MHFEHTTLSQSEQNFAPTGSSGLYGMTSPQISQTEKTKAPSLGRTSSPVSFASARHLSHSSADEFAPRYTGSEHLEHL